MIALVIAIVVAAVVFIPLAEIWALNTLFGLHIVITFWTWLAALVLGGVVSGSRVSSSSK